MKTINLESKTKKNKISSKPANITTMETRLEQSHRKKSENKSTKFTSQ
jgi:hypothetical protein